MNDRLESIDWSLTTWEGSRREQIRRWSLLTADEIFDALEEMADLAEEWGATVSSRLQNSTPHPTNSHSTTPFS